LATKNHQKITKTPIFKAQGPSKSSVLTILKNSSPVLDMLNSISVPICNHFHLRQASSG